MARSKVVPVKTLRNGDRVVVNRKTITVQRIHYAPCKAGVIVVWRDDEGRSYESSPNTKIRRKERP